MNRRDFLNYGFGLAGIIAAGKAPAAVIKSIVGARSAGIINSPESVSNPYVTDGLIAMWDGIWNVGIGKHDETSMVWKDLAGSFDLTVRDSCGFSDRALLAPSGRTTNDAAGTTSPFPSSSIRTVEIGFNATGSYAFGSRRAISAGIYNSGNRFLINQSGYDPQLDIGTRRYHLYYGGGTNYTLIGQKQMQFTFDNEYSLLVAQGWKNGLRYEIGEYVSPTSSSDSSTGIHVFGNANGNGTSSSIGWGALYGEVYYIRFYNRPLSEDELACNHSIDQERFGI